MSRPEDLELLEADVRASAPRMSPELERRLEAIVDRPPRKPWRERLWRPALVTALAGVLVAVVAVGVLRSRDSSPVAGVSRPAGSTESTQSSGSASAGSTAATPAPARAPGLAPQARRVEHDAALTLAAPARSFADVTDGVMATTDRFGGIVQRSEIDQAGRGGDATFDLRVPAARLERALAALSRLAHVRSRSAGTVDVTGAYNSAQGRLADARAERRGLLRALARAGTTAEIASLRARLRDARAREAHARRTVERLRARTDFARVEVTVVTARDSGTAAPPRDDRWTPAGAARDALRVLEIALSVLLIALAVALPLALVAGAALGGTRVARRRRRDAALSA